MIEFSLNTFDEQKTAITACIILGVQGGCEDDSQVQIQVECESFKAPINVWTFLTKVESSFLFALILVVFVNETVDLLEIFLRHVNQRGTRIKGGVGHRELDSLLPICKRV
eukprot:CAMPEP_0170546760 /NCGR_PEP_ID=MMETSP0211-20121228/5091_1 /TAXON_ID=311385 /ORGANISM="Pseudokeronopsis sp., Strain OXSARD2" /LENGTH=110 /DNA_ID=CAMNT_0010851375 /DNA_START=543 /DNA_END=875 /DNA_ORIENTATION=-